MSFGQLSIFHRTALISDVLQSARVIDVIPSVKDLHRAHESVLLHELRKQRQEENLENLQEQDEEEHGLSGESEQLGSNTGLQVQSDFGGQDQVDEETRPGKPRNLPSGRSNDRHWLYSNARSSATPQTKQGRQKPMIDTDRDLDDIVSDDANHTGMLQPATSSKKDHGSRSMGMEMATYFYGRRDKFGRPLPPVTAQPSSSREHHSAGERDTGAVQGDDYDADEEDILPTTLAPKRKSGNIFDSRSGHIRKRPKPL